MLRYRLRQVIKCSLKKVTVLFVWITIFLNNCFVICILILSEPYKIKKMHLIPIISIHVFCFMQSMYVLQFKLFTMRDNPASLYKHARGKTWGKCCFSVMAVWHIWYYTQPSSLFIHYLLNVGFLSLLARHLLFGDTIEHNRNTEWQTEVQFYRNNRFVEKTMNNSLFLLKTYMKLQNAQKCGVSYQRWQYVWLYFLQGS